MSHDVVKMSQYFKSGIEGGGLRGLQQQHMLGSISQSEERNKQGSRKSIVDVIPRVWLTNTIPKYVKHSHIIRTYILRINHYKPTRTLVYYLSVLSRESIDIFSKVIDSNMRVQVLKYQRHAVPDSRMPGFPI